MASDSSRSPTSVDLRRSLSGSCYFQTATDYFTVIESLFNRLNLPDTQLLRRATVTSMRNALVTLNSPQLFPSAIQIRLDDQGQLSEIRICYDLQYRFITCRQ